MKIPGLVFMNYEKYTEFSNQHSNFSSKAVSKIAEAEAKKTFASAVPQQFFVFALAIPSVVFGKPL